jgi:hypothetical protein
MKSYKQDSEQTAENKIKERSNNAHGKILTDNKFAYQPQKKEGRIVTEDISKYLNRRPITIPHENHSQSISPDR